MIMTFDHDFCHDGYDQVEEMAVAVDQLMGEGVTRLSVLNRYCHHRHHHQHHHHRHRRCRHLLVISTMIMTIIFVKVGRGAAQPWTC